MELKRILARDSRSANEKALQLYGKEVMIISSQRVDNQIELVVAVDSEQTPAALGASERIVGETVKDEPQAKSFGKFFQDAQLQPLPQALEQPAIVAPALPAQAEATSAYEFKRSQEIVSLLRQEIATLREDLLLTMRSRMVSAGAALSSEGQTLMHNLRESGMPASLQLLLESGLEQISSQQEGLQWISKVLFKSMKRKACSVPSKGWHALVGPTGAGKTTLAARLAYAAAVEHGAEKQALISFNDVRPGAWGQLQVLASQAGVDCFRAQDIQSLKAILDDLGPRRSVWVDTSGVQFMAGAQALALLGLQVHAVLPVDATMTHVQNVLQNKEQAWSSCFLTKADDATPSWSMIKGLCDAPVALSGFSVQAGVQAALLPYDPQQLIDAVLAGAIPQPGEPVAIKAKPVRRSASPAKRVPVRKPRQATTKAVHG